MRPKVSSRNVGRGLTFFLCVYAMMIYHDTRAQSDFSLHVRPGVSFPTSKLENASLKTGFGFEVQGAYRFMPHVSVYAGWGWNRFGSDESFAGDNTDFEETGYVFGLQFLHPFNERLPFGYFLKAGGIYNHIEVENSDGEIFSDSGHGFGFQVETGLSFSISDSWRIIPGIKYQTLSRDLRIGSVNHKIDLNYLSVGATLSKSL